MSGQYDYNPVDFHFEWTQDGKWYKWDALAARRAALDMRDEKAREHRRCGDRVKLWTLKNQRIIVGGHGHPEIELWTNVYYLNYWKPGEKPIPAVVMQYQEPVSPWLIVC